MDSIIGPKFLVVEPVIGDIVASRERLFLLTYEDRLKHARQHTQPHPREADLATTRQLLEETLNKCGMSASPQV